MYIYNEEDNNMKEDKILNNTFNSGELQYENFSQPMKVDSRVISLYEDQIGENIIEYRTKKLLDAEIYRIFIDSPYYEKYKNPKRVDKNDMIKMYYYFKDEVKKIKNFSSMEIFIGFAEFFQINYDQLYNDVGVLDKESLLKELNEKYGLQNRIKTKKLF